MDRISAETQNQLRLAQKNRRKIRECLVPEETSLDAEQPILIGPTRRKHENDRKCCHQLGNQVLLRSEPRGKQQTISGARFGDFDSLWPSSINISSSDAFLFSPAARVSRYRDNQLLQHFANAHRNVECSRKHVHRSNQ
jgi:hypothetical protein